jgi:hypothetical protein
LRERRKKWRRGSPILVFPKASLILHLPHERLEVLPLSGHIPFIERKQGPQLLRAESSILLGGRSDRNALGGNLNNVVAGERCSNR